MGSQDIAGGFSGDQATVNADAVQVINESDRALSVQRIKAFTDMFPQFSNFRFQFHRASYRYDNQVIRIAVDMVTPHGWNWRRFSLDIDTGTALRGYPAQ